MIVSLQGCVLVDFLATVARLTALCFLVEFMVTVCSFCTLTVPRIGITCLGFVTPLFRNTSEAKPLTNRFLRFTTRETLFVVTVTFVASVVASVVMAFSLVVVVVAGVVVVVGVRDVVLVVLTFFVRTAGGWVVWTWAAVSGSRLVIAPCMISRRRRCDDATNWREGQLPSESLRHRKWQFVQSTRPSGCCW